MDNNEYGRILQNLSNFFDKVNVTGIKEANSYLECANFLECLRTNILLVVKPAPKVDPVEVTSNVNKD